MSEGILVRACYAVVFDNVDALKHILSNRNIIGGYGCYLCKLAARRGAYDCFVYLYEICKSSIWLDNISADILVSMNVDIFNYVMNDEGSFNICEISRVYRYVKSLNRKDFMAIIESNYTYKMAWDMPINAYDVLARDDDLWKRIDSLIDCWNMNDETYENGLQWMPREMLEDVVFHMIESYGEFSLSIDSCIF